MTIEDFLKTLLYLEVEAGLRSASLVGCAVGIDGGRSHDGGWCV